MHAELSQPPKMSETLDLSKTISTDKHEALPKMVDTESDLMEKEVEVVEKGTNVAERINEIIEKENRMVKKGSAVVADSAAIGSCSNCNCFSMDSCQL